MPTVSIIIPSYNREQVLLNTVQDLLNLKFKGIEIVIVDQTKTHQIVTTEQLSSWHQQGKIKWIRQEHPSIPIAMNTGALKAQGDVVLFLDDDIELCSELVFEHAKSYENTKINCVAGQVVQSWQSALATDQPSFLDGDYLDPDAFQFNSSSEMQINRFMGGNVSFLRSQFITAGGFDENFSKVAYRFEAEFSERFISAGNSILFNPAASIKHLKVLEGGTRSFGDHRKTFTPAHSVGRYYYMLVVSNQKNRWKRFVSSPFKSCITRFHLKNPWWIPVTLIAEFSGMIWATYLRIKGQRLIQGHQVNSKV